MLVAGGYPGDYEKGKPIQHLDEVEGSLVFHAGTKASEEGGVLTNGGRVLAITSYGDSLAEALAQSLQQAARVTFEGKYYRQDIGFDL